MTKDGIMNLIDRSLFAEIGYIDKQGKPNIRKTFCVWHKGLGGHLISTNTSSSHVQDLLKNDKVCLYFSDEKTFEGVCLYGKAIVHTDREFKELLWNQGDEKYYPKGIDDEDYCVLEIVADSLRYYRYDGKGELNRSEIELYDKDREYENGYSKFSKQ